MEGSSSKKVQHRRRVGTARPSHLMFTGGVGALIDLPNFSVLVHGIDDWRYDALPEGAEAIAEERLLRAVQQVLGNKNVKELRPAPWMEDDDKDNSPAKRIGVPVKPFPQWLRCTGCDQLSPLESGVWGFENFQARRPDKARFYHKSCKKLKNRKPLAVAARFLLSCTNGHLDDFPYVYFVHRGTPCPNAPYPTLYMEDHGGNQGANVTIRCGSCDARHNIRAATGQRAAENLPRCRGRHPHLGMFEPEGCEVEPQMLVLGASNQWFSQTLDAFSVPEAGASALATLVAKLWSVGLEGATSQPILEYALSTVGALKPLADFPIDTVADAVEQHRKTLAGGAPAAPDTVPDLRRPEWEILTADPAPAPSEDFAVRRDGVPEKLAPLFSDVVHVERLREVRALIGFTRLDAPDPDDSNAVQRVRIARDAPTWVPASEVRGEGIFLRVDEPLLQAWESDVENSGDLAAHLAAYKRYRTNRNSGRIEGNFDPARGWPGARYIALHTLSHLLIRTIALECGYSSASLGERVYAGTPEDPWGGILIYTAVPDAEGTLGGLVSLAEAEPLERIVRRALADARRCSSDPLCAERVPKGSDDFLHGAACHVCLFVSETTCERGNKFLDRRFVVPVGGSKIALVTEEL